MFAYVGGYTTPDRDGRGNGINVFRVGPASRDWTHIQHLGGLENPSLFTLNRDTTRLYSVHGARTLVSAFRRDPADGRLTLLNQRECGGGNSVDLALDPSERALVVGNYDTGSVAVMPVAEDGALQPVAQLHVLEGPHGPDPVQQASSHPHAVIFDPSGRFVIVPDKGLDRIFVFRFEGGRITPTTQGFATARPGAAPRHSAFHPRMPVLYVNNELDSTVTVFGWDPETGELTEQQVVSTIGEAREGRNTTAEIAVRPDGRFLYISNRGRDTIAQFRIDQHSGRLTFVTEVPTGGSTPRFFTLDSSGTVLYAANQGSDTITAFEIDPEHGSLSSWGVVAQVGSPSAITLVSD